MANSEHVISVTARELVDAMNVSRGKETEVLDPQLLEIVGNVYRAGFERLLRHGIITEGQMVEAIWFGAQDLERDPRFSGMENLGEAEHIARLAIGDASLLDRLFIGEQT